MARGFAGRNRGFEGESSGHLVAGRYWIALGERSARALETALQRGNCKAAIRLAFRVTDEAGRALCHIISATNRVDRGDLTERIKALFRRVQELQKQTEACWQQKSRCSTE